MIQRPVIPALVLALATLVGVVVLLLEHLAVPEALYALLSGAGAGTLTAIVPTSRPAAQDPPAVVQSAPEATGATTTPDAAPPAAPGPLRPPTL